jgi:hypothetical protein
MLTQNDSQIGRGDETYGQAVCGPTTHQPPTTPYALPNVERSHEQYSNIYAERDALLEQVKVYGRDPTNADPIFTNEASHTCSPPGLQNLTCE